MEFDEYHNIPDYDKWVDELLLTTAEKDELRVVHSIATTRSKTNTVSMEEYNTAFNRESELLNLAGLNREIRLNERLVRGEVSQSEIDRIFGDAWDGPYTTCLPPRE